MNTPKTPSTAALWTPQTLLAWSRCYFADKGLDTPRLDAEHLLAHVLKCSRMALYLEFDRPLLPAELGAYRELVRARAGRTPVAYLTGTVGFWKLDLAVGPGCLIPRPDTETLVEVTLEAIDALRSPPAPLFCLELGTGTGAIPLALCGEREQLRWRRPPRSTRNVTLFPYTPLFRSHLLAPRGNALLLVRARAPSPLAPQCKPDLLVSNPPYIPREVIPTLAPEVCKAEPLLALDGGADGLYWHAQLIGYAAQHLAPGGRLLLEMGADQAPALRRLLAAEQGLRLLAIHKDLSGHERVLHAVKC